MLRIFRFRLLVTLALSIASLQCNGTNSASSTNKTAENSNKATETAAPPVNYGYQIINIYPHDSSAFTQGLVFIDGKLYEGTGQQGHSSLREVELQTGKVLRRVDVPEPFFAEGIALLAAFCDNLERETDVHTAIARIGRHARPRDKGYEERFR